MARKPVSFKLNEKNKTIIIYTNVDASEAEKDLKDFYLKQGYKPMFEEKKPSLTIAKMRKELSTDEAALKAFNEAYNKKEKEAFFKACKIYTDWKKGK